MDGTNRKSEIDIVCALTHNIETCIRCGKCDRMEMVEYYQSLEKALDKACEKLEWYSFTFDFEEKITKEEWKEWLMKDE